MKTLVFSLNKELLNYLKQIKLKTRGTEQNPYLDTDEKTKNQSSLQDGEEVS